MSGDVRKADFACLSRSDVLEWLHEEDQGRLEVLWHAADAARRENVGDAIHLRGLIELSNHCARQCGYCGLNADNRSVQRYRMTADEILDCARQAAKLGYGTVVMQGGEDYGIKADWLADVIRRVKGESDLAVTLSQGERPEEDLALWREAGADRYLLRFETSDAELYERIHPSLPSRKSDRFAILRTLRGLGFEVGSGVMIGIPGQTYESLANDIDLFRKLDLDMIGVGPYLPHPLTALGITEALPNDRQVPNSEVLTYKAVALTRLVRPDANIPSTTALATLNREKGRELGLLRGANVIMPNLTPQQYRKLYEIYPAKACLFDDAEKYDVRLKQFIEAMGRTIGQGQGGRQRKS